MRIWHRMKRIQESVSNSLVSSESVEWPALIKYKPNPNRAAYSIGHEMDYAFVSSTFVIVVVLPASSFSRTVQPITYSFGTVNDGETESSIQYGSYTASPYDQDYDIPSKSLSRHPSRLAHHYYDPPTEASSWPPENDSFTTSIPPASTTRRSRKKSHVPGVSNIHKPATTAVTTTVSVDPTTTESIMSPVRVRKKGRWLRVRNEIPVNEDPGGETPVSSPGPLIEMNRLRLNQTLQSNNSSHNRPASFRPAQNSSRPFHIRPGSKSDLPKNQTQLTAGSVKTNQQKWSYLRSTTTENPLKTRRNKNSSLATAERLASVQPVQVLHYTTEASTEMEIDLVPQRPKLKPKLNASGRNFDQQYNQKYKPSGNVDQFHSQPNSNVGQAYNLPRVNEQPNNLPSRNVDHLYDRPNGKAGQKFNLNKNANQPYTPPNRNSDQSYTPPNKNANQPYTPNRNADPYTPPNRNADPYTLPNRNADQYTPPSRNADPYTPPNRNADPYTPPNRNADPYTPPDRNADPYTPPDRNADPYTPPDRNADPYTPPNRNADQYTPPSRNADPYTPSNRNVDQYTPSRNVDQPLLSARNAGHFRKMNVSSRTTPVPKYKEAYFKRPPNRPLFSTVTLTSPPESQQFSGASNQEEELVKYDHSVLTTEQPQRDPEPEQGTADLDDESIEMPGTRHQSLTYSDSEKTEKTEETLQDIEYPDEEDEEEGEPDEEEQDLGEESPSKILQKPMRYSYSSDQNSSESQTHNGPQNQAAQAKKKEGGGEKHRSAHHKSEGDKAEEDYESAVEFDKAKKGHSDKENRKHHQEEEQAKKKKILEEGGHQELNHVSSKGEKGTLFGESGSHAKGHSTKGSHNIHKKNEFLKKHEFYDEHHEDDEHKKYGDYHRGHNYVKDNEYKKNHKDGDYSEGHKGKKGKNHHGHRFRQHHGHDDAFKHVDHYAHSEDYGDKGRHSEGKKWKYEML